MVTVFGPPICPPIRPTMNLPVDTDLPILRALEKHCGPIQKQSIFTPAAQPPAFKRFSQLSPELQLAIVKFTCHGETHRHVRHCLGVSRLFQEVAQVHLYRTIIIGGEFTRSDRRTPLKAAKAYALLRTFLARPELAMLVQEFAVFKVDDRTRHFELSPAEIEKTLNLLPPSESLPVRKRWLQGLGQGRSEIAALFLLCCTRNLRRLEVLTLPDRFTDSFRGSRRDWCYGRYLSIFLHSVFCNSPSVGAACFPRLLEASTDEAFCNEKYSLVSKLLQLPLLRAFRTHLKPSLLFSHGPKVCSLRNLTLTATGDVQRVQAQLADFLLHCPALEKLSIGVDHLHPHYPSTNVLPELDLARLGQALQRLEMLAHLDVHFDIADRIIFPLDPRPIRGLSNLGRLTDLSLPWWALGSFHRRSDWTDLVAAVPASLERLTLTDVQMLTTGSAWYRQGEDMLIALNQPKEMKNQLPNLESVEIELREQEARWARTPSLRIVS